MKTMFVGLLSFLIVALSCVPAGAWSHANSFGGSSAHEAGQGSEHSSAFGTSTEHKAGAGGPGA